MTTAEKQREYYTSVLIEEERGMFKYIPTVCGLMDFATEKFSDYPAISDGKISYTYRELSERVAVRRGYIKSLGYKFGDRIAIYAPNTMDVMELYLAVVTSGCVTVMLPTHLDANSLTLLCQKFDISGIFYDEELKANTEHLNVKKCSTEFVDCEPAPKAEVTKETVCSICLTSGTTGIPKGAVMTHGAIMRGAFNGTYLPDGVVHQSCIAILPLAHIYGLVYSFLARIYTGGTIYECRDIKRAIGMIPVLKPNLLVLVPGIAEVLAKFAKIKGKEFYGSIKEIVIGGAPVPPRLIKDLYDAGLTAFSGYGLTESAGPTIANKHIVEIPDSVGMVYPELQGKIVDGELRLKGDNIMLEYYGDEKNTKEAFDEDGWFKTGDLAKIDDDGNVFITGRIKNLIILPNGENVSPEELEEIFYKSEYIQDCLVKEDEMSGKEVIAIEILPYAPAVNGKSEEEIQELFMQLVKDVNSTLPTFKQISKVTVRKEDFKRTSALKIARN